MSRRADAASSGPRLHEIDIQLANQPLALYRVLGVVGRHALNLEQLVVVPTGDPGVSRARLLVRAVDVRLMARQIQRIVSVRAVRSTTADASLGVSADDGEQPVVDLLLTPTIDPLEEP